MKGLIVINANGFSEESFKQVSALKSKFDERSVAIDIRTNSDLLTYIDSDGNIFKDHLMKYDFVVYLDKDPYIAFLIQKLGIRMFNSASSIYLCDDKMLTHIALANSNIKMPKTIASPLVYDHFHEDDFKKKIMKELPFPLIVKEVYGSLGLRVHLINDEYELDNIMKKLERVPHIYQQFIKSSYGVDIRVIVINHKVVAKMKRIAKDDFRSNIHLGGKGEKIDLDPRFSKMAIDASKILGLDYCGVDILIGEEGEPILCEVNSNAFFDHISKISGVDVAKTYVDYIIKCMNRKKKGTKL